MGLERNPMMMKILYLDILLLILNFLNLIASTFHSLFSLPSHFLNFEYYFLFTQFVDYWIHFPIFISAHCPAFAGPNPLHQPARAAREYFGGKWSGRICFQLAPREICSPGKAVILCGRFSVGDRRLNTYNLVIKFR